MKKLLTCLMLALTLAVTAKAEEITLYNAEGTPTAYIDANDTDLTIYMWNGTPVAYLATGRGDYYNVYGYNGNHLGWYEDGRLYDHDGFIAGFIKGASSKYTRSEPYKSGKKYKPSKSYKKSAPYKPALKYSYSRESLSLLLMRGRN